MSKLVCGMGINDADYVVRPKISGTHNVTIFSKLKTIISK